MTITISKIETHSFYQQLNYAAKELNLKTFNLMKSHYLTTDTSGQVWYYEYFISEKENKLLDHYLETNTVPKESLTVWKRIKLWFSNF